MGLEQGPTPLPTNFPGISADLNRFERGENVQVVSGALESIAEVTEAAKYPHSSVRVLLKFMGAHGTYQHPLGESEAHSRTFAEEPTDFQLEASPTDQGEGPLEQPI